MHDLLPDWKTMDADERLRMVREMAADGLSGGGIALKFRNATRMSVVGLCYRRHIRLKGISPKPPGPARKPSKDKPRAAPRPKPVPKVEAPAFETAPLPEEELGNDVTNLIGLMDLTKDTCRWPHGDPLKEGFGFCGKQTKANSPYCEKHSARAGAGYGRGPQS